MIKRLTLLRYNFVCQPVSMRCASFCTKKDLVDPLTKKENLDAAKLKVAKSISSIKRNALMNLSKQDASTLTLAKKAKLDLLKTNAEQGIYVYKNAINFDSEGKHTIYVLNEALYKNVDFIDYAIQGGAILALYKLVRHIHAYIAFGTLSIIPITFWSAAFVLQGKLVVQSKMQKSFMIKKVHLLDNMEEIEFEVLQKWGKSKVVQVRVEDVEFSEKNFQGSLLYRLKINGLRYYCSKNAQINFDLFHAICNKEVKKIEILQP